MALQIRGPSVPRRRKPPTSRSVLPKSVRLSLQIAIVLLVFYYEYLAFYWSVTSCAFDDSPSVGTRSWDLTKDTWLEGDERWKGVKPFHALVLADPQLLDMRSYPGRIWVLRKLGVWLTDAYARKSWRLVIRTRGKEGGVDGVVWLGDLLDSGVESVDRREHSHYVHRFHLLFPLPALPSTISATPQQFPSILMPGNHDLGLHLPSASLASYSRERFEDAFGPVSGTAIWGGWELVWVDSMALLERGEKGDEARKFVETVAGRPAIHPRILLSHIPLYRPPGTSCGPSRESPRTLKQGAGKNYQNELDEGTSGSLLGMLDPVLVYSGDDHDSCIYSHTLASTEPLSLLSASAVRETTVKAFSMAMGVRRPGYHLLSLYPPHTDVESQTVAPGSPSIQTDSTFTQNNCELPDQLRIWMIYLGLAGTLFGGLLLARIIDGKSSNGSGRGTAGRSRRKEVTASSNGLPVHVHRPSHSRSISNFFFPSRNRSNAVNGLGGGAGIGADELESEKRAMEEDELFPTFGEGSNSSSIGNRYHGSIDEEDESPSSYSNGGRVRRVSRVWLWENGGRSGEDEDLGYSVGTFGNHSISTSRFRLPLSPVAFLSTLISSLVRILLLPLSKLSQPLLRPIRQQARKYQSSRIVLLLRGVGRSLGMQYVSETRMELWGIIQWGVGVWLAVIIWFMM